MYVLVLCFMFPDVWFCVFGCPQSWSRSNVIGGDSGTEETLGSSLWKSELTRSERDDVRRYFPPPAPTPDLSPSPYFLTRPSRLTPTPDHPAQYHSASSMNGEEERSSYSDSIWNQSRQQQRVRSRFR
jgi:hypothetical protein